MKWFWILLAAFPAAAQPPLRGFPPSQFGAQHELEKKLRAVPDPVLARQYFRRMAAEPHAAGQPESKAVAEYALGLLKSWGFDAQIEEFEALLPFPTKRALEMTAPTRFTATLAEPPMDEDPDSRDRNQLPTYNAYSASGDVTAPLVYVNYGVPADYEVLKKLGVDVKGKIVIARYGKSWRGTKAKTAQENGAVGCIIYSDPRDDGYFQGDVFPAGPWRPSFSAQRGSVMDMPVAVGDPLSPGWASEKGSRRLRLGEATTIMKIPVLPISHAEAQPLLAALAGKIAPEDWRGALPLTYHIGPGPATVRLAVDFDWTTKPLYNVIAKIAGAQYPDEWVIYGNHHDAWVNGASDPVSGAAALLEAARAVGELHKSGWRPKRTLVFALWDGEEFGLLGSTEWVEKHLAQLQRNTALYLNTDSVNGDRIGVAGSAVLESFIREVVRDAADPAKSPEKIELSGLGAGSDYVAFIHHAGVPSLNINSGGVGGGGTYHSIFDSIAWFEKHMDKDFTGSRGASRLLASALVRYSEAPVHPVEFSAVERNVRRWIGEIKEIDTSAVTAELDRLKPAADAYELALAWGAPADPAELNAVLRGAERALTREGGLPGRPWYRNLMAAPGLYTGYGAITIPGIRESLMLGRRAEAEAGVKELAAALRDFRQVCEKALALLPAR